MIDNENNGTQLQYRTTDFQEAIYLRIAGVLYIGIEWPTPQQANFVFRQPHDDILIEWAKTGGDDKGVRVILDAADFFRDELRRRDR